MDGMVAYIGLLLASLVAGVIVGLIKGQFSEKAKRLISMAMTGMVFVLILLMGLKTGSNDAVVSSLGVYGAQSLLITLAAIAGSIIFAVLFEKLLLKDGLR
ncbi:LysO family transporter [Methanocella conradii]|uniref:LysO family transporter n=1 Tax=Methanocella conradii TaxID=1175444 RepID=UPI00157D8E6D|nr:LysO family transporter [Methanocella conradii]